MNFLAVVLLNDCPLNHKEKEYLGINQIEIINQYLNKYGVKPKWTGFESSIGIITILWCLIAIKILGLLIIKGSHGINLVRV